MADAHVLMERMRHRAHAGWLRVTCLLCRGSAASVSALAEWKCNPVRLFEAACFTRQCFVTRPAWTDWNRRARTAWWDYSRCLFISKEIQNDSGGVNRSWTGLILRVWSFFVWTKQGARGRLGWAAEWLAFWVLRSPLLTSIAGFNVMKPSCISSSPKVQIST